MRKLKDSQIINICSSNAISNLNFVKKFEKINKISILKKKLANNLKKTVVGSNKKLKKLGWTQKFSLERALKEICQ